MIEHHFVVVYNSDTGHWYLDTEGEKLAFPRGTIYDTSTGNFRFIRPFDETREDLAATGWLEAALTKLSDETTKQGQDWVAWA